MSSTRPSRRASIFIESGRAPPWRSWSAEEGRTRSRCRGVRGGRPRSASENGRRASGWAWPTYLAVGSHRCSPFCFCLGRRRI
jgi:hypothetical protein